MQLCIFNIDLGMPSNWQLSVRRCFSYGKFCGVDSHREFRKCVWDSECYFKPDIKLCTTICFLDGCGRNFIASKHSNQAFLSILHSILTNR